MQKFDLLRQIDESVLPDELKQDAATAIDRDEIVSGADALERQLVPATIVAGSFDPATYGHLFLMEKALAWDSDAGVVVVNSTTKVPEYRLFPPVVRAALIRSYRHQQMRIILGDAPTTEERVDVLRGLHTAAQTIIKGRRRETDSEHTRSLAPKYDVPLARFVEFEPPEDLRNVSSGEVKGHAWKRLSTGTMDPQTALYLRQAVSDVVYGCIEAGLQGRKPDHNAIFDQRLAVACSEALFG